MKRQQEVSRSIAEVVGLCRPDVISAYPITPQTHIVEALSERVQSGALGKAAYVNVESEFAAMSLVIGAAAAGARAYTATSSQGLLYMAEAVYNAAGLGLPIVMTLGTRAVGAPINIWNDHSDAMAVRDAGWIQLFASTAQEAADLHVLAYRLAEELAVPVMVCVDGFLLTHAFEEVDIPTQAEVDAFLPPRRPDATLRPEAPLTIGALVGPEAFTEVKILAHETRLAAIPRITRLADELGRALGRPQAGLVRPYRAEDAEVVVVAMGSVNGTLEDVIDALRSEGVAVGSLAVGAFRPFPRDAVRAALARAKRVVVLEKNLALGMGGVLVEDVRGALGDPAVPVHLVVAGLGGRAIGSRSLRDLFLRARQGALEAFTVLDVDARVLARERGRLPWYDT